MEFKELLIKQINSYKPGWEIPKVLLAIDPGETTGYSIFRDGEMVINGVIPWTETRGWDPVVDKISEIKPNIVICEDYRLYASKANAQVGSQIMTVKIIGAIEFACRKLQIPSYKQMAHMAKDFCADEKLKEWGYWKKINPHARDSIRHACYWLLFSKEVIL